MTEMLEWHTKTLKLQEVKENINMINRAVLYQRGVKRYATEMQCGNLDWETEGLQV